MGNAYARAGDAAEGCADTGTGEGQSHGGGGVRVVDGARRVGVKVRLVFACGRGGGPRPDSDIKRGLPTNVSGRALPTGYFGALT